MITDEQRSKIAALKATIETTVTTKDGTPMGVRAEVVALKDELRRGGTTARTLAKLVSVHESTLCRWEREVAAHRRAGADRKQRRGASAGFRLVQLASGGATPKVSKPTAASLAAARALRVAHAPSGLVIDGLDVESLAALLRRMA